ncbi:hypothetical protein UFOVP58_168 [uncultured Caudovirales phage]|uniref:Uncharacterized protein n=1 Tax=uncultured Caudovirales phage TaxID=2100421 RepID=A0A6J5KWV8_9CAUD|nr:hypothetical protein UFOVP58_168 [uncultured Caudovirales phage]
MITANTISAISFDKDALIKTRQELTVQRMTLDLFMSKFLDKFEGEMDHEIPNTPVWKLYKSKVVEYNKVEHLVRLTNYYLEK